MKTLSQFLFESAAQQALRLGLEGDGHGGWYKDGEFVAKTEKGRLRFYNKRQRAGQDPPQSEREKNISKSSTEGEPLTVQSPVSPQQIPNPALQQQAAPAEDPAAQQQSAEPVSPADVMAPPEVEKTRGTLTVAFGRFNPPHAGHQQLMDVAAGSARDSEDKSDYVIVPSRTQDNKKNPLDVDAKVELMKGMFPHHAKNIVNSPANRTIFDVLKKAHTDGYANVRIVAGQDRVKEFEKLSTNYNGALYAFDNVEVLSSGDRDPDSEGVEGMSASRMRLAASENDFKTFSSGLPPEYDKKKAKQTFAAVQQAMGVSEGWQIAPKFYSKTLRENYVAEQIYKIGDIVENINNGLVGRIIRRGANHLICVTEDKIMFKSWVKDVVESAFTKISGVPASQREVGTDALRKYTERMVPGSAWGIQFINKYRKK
tara:strand:+ start:2091 stop:3374 length:1284 start_codon:yes stop_codon:yes gene_type:complete